ncbi:hypothetical protein ACIGXF_25165 [Streptomyces sp. NPDC053086]|uniref:hypothetical protein n=1 Tax=unclassified Streptomyces TaxID=2593676 RepID=UPI0037CCEDDD
MDDGVVALITAGVGLVGAVGGAAIGGLAAARGARIGAETAARATARQVQDQAFAAHMHWLREQRLEAYKSMLVAYEGYADTAMAWHAWFDGAGSDREAEPEDLVPYRGAIVKIHMQIRLVGPAAVREAVRNVRRACQDHLTQLAALKSLIESGVADDSVDRKRAELSAALAALRTAYDVFLRRVSRIISTHQPDA